MTDAEELMMIEETLRLMFAGRHFALFYQTVSGHKTGLITDAETTPETVRYIITQIMQMLDQTQYQVISNGSKSEESE